MSESGNFDVNAFGSTALGFDRTKSLMPSWKISKVLRGNVGTEKILDAFNPTNMYNRVKGDTKLTYTLKMSIDFADFLPQNYAIQRFSSGWVYPLIGTSQVKPSNVFAFSKIHGLIVNSGGSYASYATRIVCPINAVGMSIWFYRKSGPTDPALFTAYSGLSLPTGNGFYLHLGNGITAPHITIGGTGGGSVDFAPTGSFQTNLWTHLFIFWGAEGTDLKVKVAINGSPYAVVSVTPFTPGTPSGILLGGKTNNNGLNFDPADTFSGYIRRVEILDITTNVLSSTAIDSSTFFTKYITYFSQSPACSPYLSLTCSYCDKFTGLCFSPFTLNRRPDNSADCPSECESKYFASCDNSGVCDACTKDPLCMACDNTGKCIHCRKDTFWNEALQKCLCRSGTYLVESTNTCETCHSLCRTCSSPSDSTKCTSCDYGYYFLKNSPTTGSCVKTCPSTMTPDENQVCTLQCHERCRTCSQGNNATKCTSCREGYYLLGNYEGTCEVSCPNNTAYNATTHQCETCHESCKTCILPQNPNSCIQCNGTLVKTNIGDTSIGTCTPSCSINNNTYTDETLLLCYPDGKCPITTYKDVEKRQCLKCHESCFGCAQPNNSVMCKGCISQILFLNLAGPSTDYGECVRECPANTDPDPIRHICLRQIVSPAQKKSVSTITDTVNGVTSAATVTSMFSSILLSGNIGIFSNFL